MSRPEEGSPAGPGKTQLLVRETMLQAGGYWRPLAAVARLAEELGELAELLSQDEPSPSELAGELADLFVITAALADQYLANLPEPGPTTVRGGGDLAAVVQAAGPIARIVNHYDGPKTPRAGTTLPALGETIRSFHAELGALAASLGVELGTAVADKLQTIRARGDLTRFQPPGHDPSTAPVLARYRAEDPRGALLRLWGAPDWQGEDVVANASAIEPWLSAFAKAARAESLDGFLIATPRPQQLLSTLGEDRSLVVREDLEMHARTLPGAEPYVLLTPADQATVVGQQTS